MPGMSTSTANSILDAICNNVSYVIANTYIQLHTGLPGINGTSNIATEATRKLVSWGAASGGVISNDAAIEWTNIAGSQDATHWTLGAYIPVEFSSEVGQ